jgi:hypothetical protein
MLKRALSGLVMYTVFGALAAHAGQFLDAPQYPVGASPQAVAVGDFNGDGNLDVAVANSTDNTISVLLGNGDGTFRTQLVYKTDIAPEGIAVGRFDTSANNYLDIAVTNSGSNLVSVFLGNGDGTFQPKVDYATGPQPQGIAVWDLRGDGKSDIIVTNAAGAGLQNNTVGVLLGNGDGTFQKQVTYKTGDSPWSVAVGDVNNDGVPDLVVANYNNNNVVSVLLGNGDGTFQGQLQSQTGNTPVSVALADFNGDGNLDIAVADQAGNTVSVLLGNGSGNFPTHVEYPTAAFPTAVTVGDFNGDGITDLAVSEGNGNTVSVFWGKGDGTFKAALNIGTGDIPYSAVAGDFNNDHTDDIVVANSGGNNISLILSNGKDKTFQTRTDFPAGEVPAKLNVGPNPNSVVTADFKGDGVLDLAVASSNCPTPPPTCGVAILMGNGDGTFRGPMQFATGNYINSSIAAGDFNGDGFPDLAVTNYASGSSAGSVSVMLGVGDGTFGSPTDFSVGSEPASVAVGNLAGTSKLDLAVANFDSNTVSVLLGNGDGTFQPAVNYPVGNGPISVAVGDFNGDQVPDLVVVNETDQTVGILLGSRNGNGTPTGTFKPMAPYSTGKGGNPLSVVVGDFNGDGKLDLAVADMRAELVSVLLGNGDGSFQPVQIYPTGANPSSIVIGDFNGDGKLDLAMTSTPLEPYPGNLVSLLLGNGDGTFGTPTLSYQLFGTGSQAYSAVVGDFNGDGALDLAIANGISDTVSVLLNTQGTAMSFVSLPSGDQSTYGQSVTFTATVAASVPNGATPTGSVTVMNGPTILGSGNVENGPYSVSLSTLPVGKTSLSAVYTSTNGYQQHTLTLIQTVEKAASSTALTSSATSSGLNQSVTFTATVSPSTSGQPTGTVTFSDGTTPLGSPSLSAGVATLAIATLAIGTHTITATYNGDGNFNLSISKAVSLAVTAVVPDFSLSSSPASLSVTPGASGESTITISPLGGLNPSTVALTCSISTSLSPAPTCSLGAMAMANNLGSSMLTVDTTGAQAALAPPPQHGSGWLFAIAALMPAMFLSAAGLNTPSRRRLLGICLVFLVLGGCLLEVACGGSGSNNTPPSTIKTNSGTPAGTYMVTITGKASGEQHSTSVSLTVQ